MANKRIDELDGLTTLGGSEQIAIVSSAATYHTTVAALKTHIVGGTNGLEDRVRDVEAKLSAQGTPGTVQAACKVIDDEIVEGSAFNVKKYDSANGKITFSKNISMSIPFITGLVGGTDSTDVGTSNVGTAADSHLFVVELGEDFCKVRNFKSKKGKTEYPSNFSFAVIGA